MVNDNTFPIPGIYNKRWISGLGMSNGCRDFSNDLICWLSRITCSFNNSIWNLYSGLNGKLFNSSRVAGSCNGRLFRIDKLNFSSNRWMLFKQLVFFWTSRSQARIISRIPRLSAEIWWAVGSDSVVTILPGFRSRFYQFWLWHRKWLSGIWRGLEL